MRTKFRFPNTHTAVCGSDHLYLSCSHGEMGVEKEVSEAHGPGLGYTVDENKVEGEGDVTPKVIF